MPLFQIMHIPGNLGVHTGKDQARPEDLYLQVSSYLKVAKSTKKSSTVAMLLDKINDADCSCSPHLSRNSNISNTRGAVRIESQSLKDISFSCKIYFAYASIRLRCIKVHQQLADRGGNCFDLLMTRLECDPSKRRGSSREVQTIFRLARNQKWQPSVAICEFSKTNNFSNASDCRRLFLLTGGKVHPLSCDNAIETLFVESGR